MKDRCPTEIGGARVVGYAIVHPNHFHTQNTTQIVNGLVKPKATAMIIAQYQNEDCYYVFGCYTDQWITETDTWHETLEDAIEQLDWEYTDLSKSMVWYSQPPNYDNPK